VKTVRRVRQICCISPILFNLYSEYSTKEGSSWRGWKIQNRRKRMFLSRRI